jgi:hypothetical protein
MVAQYRIFRMKESARTAFRSAPHTGGLTPIKPKDYEQEPEHAEADSPYALWTQRRGMATALQVGDVLVDEADKLVICKYIGFEPAQWVLPEVKPDQAPAEPVEAAAQPQAG